MTNSACNCCTASVPSGLILVQSVVVSGSCTPEPCGIVDPLGDPCTWWTTKSVQEQSGITYITACSKIPANEDGAPCPPEYTGSPYEGISCCDRVSDVATPCSKDGPEHTYCCCLERCLPITLTTTTTVKSNSQNTPNQTCVGYYEYVTSNSYQDGGVYICQETEATPAQGSGKLTSTITNESKCVGKGGTFGTEFYSQVCEYDINIDFYFTMVGGCVSNYSNECYPEQNFNKTESYDGPLNFCTETKTEVKTTPAPPDGNIVQYFAPYKWDKDCECSKEEFKDAEFVPFSDKCLDVLNTLGEQTSRFAYNFDIESIGSLAQQKLQFRIAYLPPASCYFKVWLIKANYLHRLVQADGGCPLFNQYWELYDSSWGALDEDDEMGIITTTLVAGKKSGSYCIDETKPYGAFSFNCGDEVFENMQFSEDTFTVSTPANGIAVSYHLYKYSFIKGEEPPDPKDWPEKPPATGFF